MCTIVNYQPCHHYRWFLKPDYSQSYLVKRITGNSCSPIIELSMKINGSTEIFKIKTLTQITKGSGKIYVEVVAIMTNLKFIFQKI